MTNEAERNQDFNFDIDNQSGIKDIKNLIIGPIFHHKKSNGVIQIFNKIGGPFTALDLEKFK